MALILGATITELNFLTLQSIIQKSKVVSSGNRKTSQSLYSPFNAPAYQNVIKK